MQKIGVVVTVYNLQDYVEECVNSILNQEYDNLEMVQQITVLRYVTGLQSMIKE